MVERRRPESAHMPAVVQLILVHQPERAWKGLAEGDAARGQPFSQAFCEIFQYFAAPGELLPVCRLFAGGKDLGLPLCHVGFDGSAEMFGSHGVGLLHAGGREQG